MRPDQDELDDEIRGHMAISLKERIERGEDPEAARLAALREFGNVTLTRDSMRAVWRPGWFDMAEALGRDIRFALRALMRAKGLAATVVVTLALGIGAENTTFSVPEIDDIKSRVTTISAFGDFSTVDFTMLGLGDEPRVVK